ncbi:FAD-binding oxidoreductase [Jiangella rhizosphaerae]|uniref:FAD-binding oxidoreductase n=1 Tax=Jiangella rhizosphaerae TaxID=2293569 RepID=A0A418KTD9_9ACTN|nr:FAD-dependent oxidoreductase [Jiangella rhizosphaerae]RIQ28172.1 FAD-binding oxidoreductase [Jiangella rhizosphaerae]
MSELVLPGGLRDRAVRPGDRRYPLLRSTYTRVSAPSLVLLPESPAEVAASLEVARDSGLPLSVRSGGHGLSGRSSNDGGIVLDVSAMNGVEVLDEDARLVRVGAGARWANVAAALAPHGWAISSGDHGNVGVGGLATAGGIGWLARSYGLTIDHIRAAEVVLPDGRLVRADATHEPDLFWAVRGAGDGVGVVVAFEIEATPLRTVGFGQVVVEADRDGDTLRRWSEYVAAAPHELTGSAVLFADGADVAAQFTAVVASDDQDLVRELIAPLAEFGVRPLSSGAQLAPYPALVSTGHLHPNVGQQPSTTTNALLPALTEASARALMEVAAGPQRTLVQLRALGGAINEVAPDATAYAHRHQQVLAILTQFPPGGGTELDAAAAPLAPYADGAYRNFESRPDDDTFRRAFPGATGDRVRALRERYDPGGLLQRVAAAEPARPR